jgi:O-antigen ligase
MLFIGTCLVAGLFFLLKFTYVGQSNYQVQRMRSAFDLKDPSFKVRIKNQLKLSEYLEVRPFGGGIGSAGYWGIRFSPDTFLAKTPMDSWYVKIWAETGIVGIILYLLITVFILGYLAVRLWRYTDPLHRQPLLALFAGLAGIFVANYGNQLLGQMPTNILFYLSIAVIYNLTMSKNTSTTKDLHVQK